MNLSAVIMAGGFGNRLKPLTAALPKPMLPVANYPMIDYVVNHLNREGIKNIVYTLGYMPEKIIDWASGYDSLNQHFVVEDKPLGTCGAVNAVKHLLSDVFFVLSGDALENIDLSKMLEFHLRSGAEVTMATTTVNNPSLYGVVQSDKSGFAVNFIEKPPQDIIDKLGFDPVVNCGVYVVNKSALKSVPKGSYDFSKDLFPILKDNRKLACFYHDGYWCDLGDIKSYYNSNFYFLKNNFFPLTNNYKRLFLESSFEPTIESLAARSSKNRGNVMNSIIGSHSTICENVFVNNCIVLDSAVVNQSAYGSIIGSNFLLNVMNNNYAPLNSYSVGNVGVLT